MKRDVQEKGVFIDPKAEDFQNSIYNFTNGSNTSGRYRRIDMVVNFGAFVSGIPPEQHTEYEIENIPDGQAYGGRTASGKTIPIPGERRLQVSLIETVQDFKMNFEVIKGLTKALCLRWWITDAASSSMEGPQVDAIFTIDGGMSITRSSFTMASTLCLSGSIPDSADCEKMIRIRKKGR